MQRYEGVSKSPRTMLITRKSIVVHEFPATVCCGGVLWGSVMSGMVGCGSVWLLHVSLCVYCISRLPFSEIGSMAEVDKERVCIKVCVRLGKTGSETSEMLKQAFGESCMSSSQTFEWFGRFKNGRILTANDDRSGRPSTAWQQPPQKWNRYGRLSTRIIVDVPYTISVQRLELVMDLVSEFWQNSWTCIGLQWSLWRECWPRIRKTVE